MPGAAVKDGGLWHFNIIHSLTYRMQYQGRYMKLMGKFKAEFQPSIP